MLLDLCRYDLTTVSSFRVGPDLTSQTSEEDTFTLSSRSRLNKIARKNVKYSTTPDRRAGKRIILPPTQDAWNELKRPDKPSVFFYKVPVPGGPADDGLISIFPCELNHSEEQLKSIIMTEDGQVFCLDPLCRKVEKRYYPSSCRNVLLVLFLSFEADFSFPRWSRV